MHPPLADAPTATLPADSPTIGRHGTFRHRLRDGDAESIAGLLQRTGFFNQEEVRIGRELAEETLSGASSDYVFLLADNQLGNLLGYACFGPIPLTQSSWDLYWIAVDPGRQAGGLGRALLRASEAEAVRRGATQFLVDTSGRTQYQPTRRFYEACGYEVVATLPDFYAPGDDKVIFHKVLTTA